MSQNQAVAILVAALAGLDLEVVSGVAVSPVFVNGFENGGSQTWSSTNPNG